jgi:3-keto-5-aminohexanoate cleavage enzyme
LCFDKRQEFQNLRREKRLLIARGNLKPDMGSMTLSSLNFNKMESMNSPDMIMRLIDEMNRRGIKPELEAFDAGMINYARYLIQKNLLKPPYYFNLLFGNIACAQADLLHAGIMVRDLPQDAIWAFAGIGDEQLKMNSIAIATGGGVRIGVEDNIWFDKNRTIPAKNIDLIKRIHLIAEANERPVMPSSKMRQLLKLLPGNGRYGVAS